MAELDRVLLQVSPVLLADELVAQALVVEEGQLRGALQELAA